eukprot:CAMPEP_0177351034 /NCGR_PEP_ID=MMETSP0368-20130122/31631_1 /TAXON_ID=447022 ORGANISM="Scrippsiella hangoei-like, Strain SHHI-4" /NCGR_SAMPLE_ID=MMETSP0368 /ASSEMBLY_ACC=CAM_ASM_000363 /LENGTH=260 /DNA_ID=CAMNT_0018812981 /DNA_START=73 /DNA_END=852 /DNA_ORIENTATION=+
MSTVHDQYPDLVTNADLERARSKAVEHELVKWGPLALFLTFALTLGLSAFISIRLSEGSPCGEWLCDISVYGGWPKNGAEQIVFRTGFVLIALQCLVICCGRCRLIESWTCTIFYGAAIVAMLMMAFIPFYASPVHFYSAAGTFACLALGQWSDATNDRRASPSMTTARKAMIIATVTFFGIWFGAENFAEVDWPVLEYMAAFLPFLYFTTWSYQLLTLPTGLHYLLIKEMPIVTDALHLRALPVELSAQALFHSDTDEP